jgi:hypothetical protein
MQISMFPPVQRMLMLLVEWVKRLVACACVPGLSSHSLTTRQDRRFVDFCKFNIKCYQHALSTSLTLLSTAVTLRPQKQDTAVSPPRSCRTSSPLFVDDLLVHAAKSWSMSIHP